MALGASPSEAEAASALEKARMLLARHGLSMADVDTKSPEVTENVLLEKKRLRVWESHLIAVVTQATFTQAIHVSGAQNARVLIIGREVNAVSAANLFEYLHLVVLKLGRAHSGEVAHLESFKVGVVQRIGERLSDLGRAQERGATPVKAAKEAVAELDDSRQLTVLMSATAERENEAYIAGKFGQTKRKRMSRGVEPSSYYRGREAGNGVSLNRQLR